MSAITTHVLDTARGKPAASVPIVLELRTESGAWERRGAGSTDADGRLRDLLGSAPLVTGTWRLTFDVSAYHQALGVQGFFPEVQLVFLVTDAAAHHHVPLLLSPFGFTTYRGS